MSGDLHLSARTISARVDSYFLDSTVAAQRARLIETLRLGSINAFEARQRLEVIDPHERVRDLRLLGHNIQTNLVWMNVETKRKCVPEYRLLLGQCHPRHSHAGSPP